MTAFAKRWWWALALAALVVAAFVRKNGAKALPFVGPLLPEGPLLADGSFFTGRPASAPPTAGTHPSGSPEDHPVTVLPPQSKAECFAAGGDVWETFHWYGGSGKCWSADAEGNLTPVS